MRNPNNIIWNYGMVPPVEEKRAIILLADTYAGYAVPWENELNPLRWSDNGGYPRWGFERPVGYWCYLEDLYPKEK